ncbi:DUF2059 domain-containing protein [Sphingopyxis sp. L1A2A]|uniref:DUF2059 domain-containing protein n=1 Tax=Sphingopyxis sp. L1A2A TaxID=2502247 RepID=UPI002016A21A|nr:DUF2059 domain-containing protein [Sphingopyxis sp. L1A2A]
MSTWKHMLLAGAAAIAPAHAFAAPTEAPLAEVVATEDAQTEYSSEAAMADAKAKMQKEIDQVIALIEKIYGTDKLPPVAPAQLALAQQTTAALVPPGSLEKMIDNLYGKLFKGILGEMGGMSDLMLSIKTGVESEKIALLDEPSKTAIADMLDPYRQQREDQVMTVIKPLISEALRDMEAPMRSGMAQAYARKFTAQQLTDMNGFFATPAGGAYTSEWMALQADPQVMLTMIKAVPPLITKFMDRAPAIEKDMKELPKEKQLSDLSDAELTKLAKLMKVDVKVLKEQRDMWTGDAVDTTAVDAATDEPAYDASADAAVEAAEAAADAAASIDPAFDRNNWSAADRKRVEDAEAAIEAASVGAVDAEETAVANARKRLPPSAD